MSIIKLLNPLGYISDCYSKTLNYKLETKKLEKEIVEIRLQAKLMHTSIDSTLKLKMEELHQRRMVLAGFFESVHQEMERLHIERGEVLLLAKNFQAKSFEKGISIEEKKLFADYSTEILKQLPLFGNRASESLQQLVQAIPPVKIPLMLNNGRI